MPMTPARAAAPGETTLRKMTPAMITIRSNPIPALKVFLAEASFFHVRIFRDIRKAPEIGPPMIEAAKT